MHSVPIRLYAVSKSYLESEGGKSAPAAAVADGAPPPTAPTNAVAPARFRNALRSSPPRCAMGSPFRLARHTTPADGRVSRSMRQRPKPAQNAIDRDLRRAVGSIAIDIS